MRRLISYATFDLIISRVFSEIVCMTLDRCGKVKASEHHPKLNNRGVCGEWIYRVSRAVAWQMLAVLNIEQRIEMGTKAMHISVLWSKVKIYWKFKSLMNMYA